MEKLKYTWESQSYSEPLGIRTNRFIGIYEIEIDGKFYVGMYSTLNGGVLDRINGHRSALRRQSKDKGRSLMLEAYNQIEDKSLIRFNYTRLNLSKKELVKIESLMIEEYKCKGVSLNYRVGNSHTQEFKDNLKNRHLTMGHPMSGRKHTQEVKDKMSFDRIGEKNSNYKGVGKIKN